MARSYALELTVALVGSIVALLDALVGHLDVSLVVVAISFLLATSVALLRNEIEKIAGAREVVRAIPDPRWREDAVSEIEELRLRHLSWHSGTRHVPAQSSLNYQIDLLDTARASVDAVHVALDADAMQMWFNKQKPFYRLVDHYRGLGEAVKCRRILVLDDRNPDVVSNAGGRRTVIHDALIEAINLQAQERASGGLGFEVRVQWESERKVIATNVLIVDNAESCTIDNLGPGRFNYLECTVNPVLVRQAVVSFRDQWTDAIPVSECLPLVPAPGT